MNRSVPNAIASIPLAGRIYLLIFALGFPVAWIGHRMHWFELYDWLAMVPALVWKGQVWRVLTYAFLPGGPVDWLVSLFWLVTLVSVLGRNWSSAGFWGYNFLAAVSGAAWCLLLAPHSQKGMVGAGAMIFALLVAWDRLYRNERLILMGFGEISVRQAVMLVAIIDSVVLFFCCGGWFYMLAMWCGGVVAWVYWLLRGKRLMRGGAQTLRSERIARLEL